MKKVAIDKDAKIQLGIFANITDEDRHTARFFLKKGKYVRVTKDDGRDHEPFEDIFIRWFRDEYGDQGEVVEDKDTGRKYCHLLYDLSW